MAKSCLTHHLNHEDEDEEMSNIWMMEAPQTKLGTNEDLGATKSVQDKQLPIAQSDLTVFQAHDLSEWYNLPPGQVTAAWKIFKCYDASGIGLLSTLDFQLLLRAVLRERYPTARTVPRQFFSMASAKKEPITFSDFLQWVSENAFSELINLSSEQREIRRLAQVTGRSVPEVESIKEQFDVFDKDASGKIDYEEFCHLLCVLLGIKEKEMESLPDHRVKAFWHEVDSDRNGFIEFAEFIPWYLGYFDTKGNVSTSPAQAFYRNVRPVCVFKC